MEGMPVCIRQDECNLVLLCSSDKEKCSMLVTNFFPEKIRLSGLITCHSQRNQKIVLIKIVLNAVL